MNAGLLLLRLVVGLAFAAHGSQKLFGAFGGGGPLVTAGFFQNLGFRAPLMMALLAGVSEFAGGLAFTAGIATPLAALALTVVMVNAVVTVHWAKGFWNGNGGYEFNLLLATVAVAVAAIGPGRFSLDRALRIDGNISGLQACYGKSPGNGAFSMYPIRRRLVRLAPRRADCGLRGTARRGRPAWPRGPCRLRAAPRGEP